MLEMGNQQVAPWAGGYPCAGGQVGTGRSLGELPFPSAPQCGTGTSPCSPSPSCSHSSPNVWLSVLSSLAGLMQSLGQWRVGCPWAFPLRKCPTRGHLPDIGTGWPGAPIPYWEYPQGKRSWCPHQGGCGYCCFLLSSLSQLSARVQGEATAPIFPCFKHFSRTLPVLLILLQGVWGCLPNASHAGLCKPYPGAVCIAGNPRVELGTHMFVGHPWHWVKTKSRVILESFKQKTEGQDLQMPQGYP